VQHTQSKQNKHHKGSESDSPQALITPSLTNPLRLLRSFLSMGAMGFGKPLCSLLTANERFSHINCAPVFSLAHHRKTWKAIREAIATVFHRCRPSTSNEHSSPPVGPSSPSIDTPPSAAAIHPPSPAPTNATALAPASPSRPLLQGPYSPGNAQVGQEQAATGSKTEAAHADR
jgi:hypothetical protein